MPHDPTTAEYEAEIARLTRIITKYRGSLKCASKPATVHRLNRTLYTLYTGRGQLRRVVRYLKSTDRLRT